ncbi:MAG: hypothetical protein EA381_11465 [Planctomycetaceae bacterium]|nr:MAG: hypothetical protein EA381_11465 [Planctomycetaceae bacterium]
MVLTAVAQRRFFANATGTTKSFSTGHLMRDRHTVPDAPSLACPRFGLNFRLIFACGLLLVCGRASAYSPEDPEVRAMVDRGIAYLEGLSEDELKLKNYGDPEGQPMVIAYAHLKAEGDPSAPLVQIGLRNALGYVKKIRANVAASRHHGHKATYELSIAIMLLIEIDPRTHAEDIQFLADTLLADQMSHGGYGYHGEPHGDSSQVQYVTLAMWTLDRAGFQIDLDRVGRVVEWIVRVQDPTGYWTYKPHFPPGGGMISQNRTQLSMSTCLAAGSAVLIAADVLRQWGETEGLESKIEGLPKAVKMVATNPGGEQKVVAARKQATRVPAEGIRASIARLENYRSQNPFRRPGGPDWFYYMMYTLERYESFMELARPNASGRTGWYDEGVTALRGLQDSSGAWGAKDPSYNSAPVSTAFAILFLIRSTKKSIAKASRGTVAGGYRLPSDTTKIVVSGTQIQGEPTANEVTDLLGLLESDDADQFDQKSLPEDLQLEPDPRRRRQQLDRLERLVRGSQSWQARRVAAKLLGKTDELSVVPALIFALSDPDTVVRRSAADGLRFISRKFDESILPDKPTNQEIRAAQQKWRQWYLSIFPDHVFLDQGI